MTDTLTNEAAPFGRLFLCRAFFREHQSKHSSENMNGIPSVKISPQGLKARTPLDQIPRAP